MCARFEAAGLPRLDAAVHRLLNPGWRTGLDVNRPRFHSDQERTSNVEEIDPTARCETDRAHLNCYGTRRKERRRTRDNCVQSDPRRRLNLWPAGATTRGHPRQTEDEHRIRLVRVVVK